MTSAISQGREVAVVYNFAMFTLLLCGAWMAVMVTATLTYLTFKDIFRSFK